MLDNTPRKNPPPFLSDVKRFSDQNHTGPENLLGPGHYEASLPAFENKKHSNYRVFAESHRFESYGSYVDIKKARNLPGPGTYNEGLALAA